ncbi:MAG: sulfotransferase family 2 domain-containing protein [Croceibacterium sp.]
MKRAGVAFVHIPRTAGMSITTTLYHRFLGHFPVEALLAVKDPALLALPRFTVVRDPWRRLASAYHFALRGRGEGGMSADVAPHVHRQIAAIPSFEHFVKDWLPQQDLMKLDGVLRPQVYYAVARDGTVPFDHVGRLEELSATSDWLSNVLGRKIEFPRTNTSGPSERRDEFDPEMRDIVARLYAEDVSRFGYRV